MSEELLTIPEAAREKGAHPKSLYRAVRAGRVASVKRYGRVLVTRGDLEKWSAVPHRPKKETNG